ncbi:MAG: ABC transporter ATP-binding protein [Dehalococcoidia bacterium]|nr:ABC transporter ATP-binding protein [Dehalococcoidia bacterium]
MQVAPERDATTAGRDGDVVLRTRGLSKRFGPRLAVDGLDLGVRRGRVYGFLGPNGSGKTTTIGMIFGLVRPDAGEVSLFGADALEPARILRRVGAVLEGPSYLPHLSARDNLRVFGLLSGGMPPARLDAVLELVGLTARAGDKVRTYSLGMKQRLAVAGALLHDPELLILDEPTNGLDPAGMREFRDLIRELPRAGKTVFVSSHLLGEVEQMCDDVGILKAGRLLTQGPVEQLLAAAGVLELRVTDADAAVHVLDALPWAGAVTRDGDRLTVEAPPERAADVSRALAERGIYLRELRAQENRLEDVFLHVTGEAADA